jgi:chromosome segregation ATPase
VAHLLTGQEAIEDENVRYTLNDLAQQRSAERLAALESLLPRLEQQRLALSEEVTQLMVTLQEPVELERQIEDLRGQLADLRRRRSEQAPQLFEYEDLQSQISKQQEQVAEAQHEITGLQEELARLQAAEKSLDAKRKRCRETRQEVQQRLEDTRRQLREEIEVARSEEAAAREELERLESELARQQAERVARQQEHQQAKVQAEAALEAVWDELENLEGKLEQHRRFFGPVLDNVPADLPKVVREEIDTLKRFLDEEAEDSLKKRILAIRSRLPGRDDLPV